MLDSLTVHHVMQLHNLFNGNNIYFCHKLMNLIIEHKQSITRLDMTRIFIFVNIAI